jgi:hypothetical protein
MTTGFADPTTAAKPRKRLSAKPSDRKAGDRVKCTLLLTAENDLKLTVLAALRGVDRSALVNQVLAEAVRGVVVSLRGPAGDMGEDRQAGGAL